MPKITWLDPENTGSATWGGKTFAPNKAVDVDDPALLASASASPKFWKVSGLTGDDKEAAEEAAAEAKAAAEREQAAIQAEDEADEAAAEAEREASEAITKPGAQEAKQAAQTAPQTKKPGAR